MPPTDVQAEPRSRDELVRLFGAHLAIMPCGTGTALHLPANQGLGVILRVDYEDVARNTYATEIELALQGANSKVVATRYLNKTEERFTWTAQVAG